MSNLENPQTGGTYVRNQDGSVTRQGGTKPLDAFKATDQDTSNATEPADDGGDKTRKGK